MTFFGCPEPSQMFVYYSHLQVLNSGNIDVGYLGKILDFALITLQKLSAPAKVDELKIAHQKFLADLSEICQATDDASNKLHITALVKGLQFVMEQMQVGSLFIHFFPESPHRWYFIIAPLTYWRTFLRMSW